MTDPRDCRPPEGTSDGTWCLLQSDKQQNMIAVMWRLGAWVCHTWVSEWPTVVQVGTMTGLGWRFHSIAEPPHE